MHKLFVLITLLFLSGIFLTTMAQEGELKTVRLNQEDGLLASPSQFILFPGDTLKFVAEDGQFSVFIPNAKDFLRIRTTNLSLTLDSNDQDKKESILYIIKDIETDIIQCPYSIYSIGNDGWPLAPPKIIIRAN